MCDCSCTRCYFPAAACIASVIFCIVVGILLWRASVFMIYRVINRTLQRRLRTFLGLFVSGRHLPSAAHIAPTVQTLSCCGWFLITALPAQIPA